LVRREREYCEVGEESNFFRQTPQLVVGEVEFCEVGEDENFFRNNCQPQTREVESCGSRLVDLFYSFLGFSKVWMFHNEGILCEKKNGFGRSQHIKFWAIFPKKKDIFYLFIYIYIYIYIYITSDNKLLSTSLSHK